MEREREGGDEGCGTCKSGANVKHKSGGESGFVRCVFSKPYEWWSNKHKCERYERRTDQR